MNKNLLAVHVVLLAALCADGSAPLFSVTVEEKRRMASVSSTGPQDGDAIKNLNEELAGERRRLETLSGRAIQLYANEAAEGEYVELLEQVNKGRKRILELENAWRESIVTEAKRDEEGYALWDQEETTLASLVVEYGATDFLYVVPPELAAIKINMHSGIPIPRESWGEALEIILTHNGIGIKRLNTYARQLYVLKQDLSSVQAIASSPDQLRFTPPQARIFYVFSPPVEQTRSVLQFFERFSDARQTFVHYIGGKIALVATRDDVERLLNLYRTVWQDSQGKVTKVITVTKIPVKEMEKILQGFFGEVIDRGGARPPFPNAKPDQQEGLSVLSLSSGNALVLIGSQEIVDRAEKIVRSTEEQLLDPSEVTVYLYTCRHSDPVDLAKVLEKVYNSLLIVPAEPNKEIDYTYQNKPIGPNPPPPADGYPPNVPPLMIGPRPLNSGTLVQAEVIEGSDRFIPDPKTGTLLMVVRRDALSKIKDLLRQIDVPKKMVQIEVLMFEKKHNTQNNFGLNFLKIGPDRNHVTFDGLFSPRAHGKGVLSFFLGKNSGKHFPAFDLTYSFLMAQEDIQLHAAPSVMTVNQTPATISIQEEISINNGAAPIDTNKGIAFEKSFSRANYGITIMMTPIIHSPPPGEDKEEETGFITLQTNITFDTTKPHPDDRPHVERRHIENEVRVSDGETIIIGGLRRSSMIDEQDKVPFLGDLPVIGRLFGSTRLIDNNTEMFFFITPRIVLSSREKMEELRMEELQKRPGDIPEFLERVIEARECEERCFFTKSIKTFFCNKRT